jgi:hypothetical protein
MTDIMENTKVKCDEPDCLFIIDVQWESVPDWYNKACPTCDKGVMINDADIVAWSMVSALNTADKIIDPEKKLPRESVVLDTSVLRGSEASK